MYLETCKHLYKDVLFTDRDIYNVVTQNTQQKMVYGGLTVYDGLTGNFYSMVKYESRSHTTEQVWEKL